MNREPMTKEILIEYRKDLVKFFMNVIDMETAFRKTMRRYTNESISHKLHLETFINEHFPILNLPIDVKDTSNRAYPLIYHPVLGEKNVPVDAISHLLTGPSFLSLTFLLVKIDLKKEIIVYQATHKPSTSSSLFHMSLYQFIQLISSLEGDEP
jgi:hypothetical protein